MRLALDEARQALAEGEVPIGAVVVCQNRVVARAHNLTETLTDPTAHAEMQAITMATSLLGGKYLPQQDNIQVLPVGESFVNTCISFK